MQQEGTPATEPEQDQGGHVHGPDCAQDHDQAMVHTGEPFRRSDPKVGRNDPCPCGSGRKFKKCCAKKS